MANTKDIATRLLSDIQRDYGLSAPQAAGVVGNFMHESGGFNSLQEISPLVPGSRGGYGYAQWTGPRRREFEDYVARNNLDPTSYEANYGFLQHELANDPYERRQFDTVRNAQTAEEAARLISQNYLRPGIPHMDSRINYANQVLGYAPTGGAPPPATSAPPIMRASSPPPRQGNSFFSPLSGLLANVQLPQVNMPAMSPQVQRGALAPLLGTVAGRTALWNAFMPSNIGAAPTVTQGHSGPGTRAYAVNSSGTNPVMLASSGGGGRGHGGLDTNTHMNMDVYRANAGVLGGSGFTQSNIDRALSEGRTLFTL